MAVAEALVHTVERVKRLERIIAVETGREMPSGWRREYTDSGEPRWRKGELTVWPGPHVEEQIEGAYWAIGIAVGTWADSVLEATEDATKAHAAWVAAKAKDDAEWARLKGLSHDELNAELRGLGVDDPDGLPGRIRVKVLARLAEQRGKK